MRKISGIVGWERGISRAGERFVKRSEARRKPARSLAEAGKFWNKRGVHFS
jgi:hypothetical protein